MPRANKEAAGKPPQGQRRIRCAASLIAVVGSLLAACGAEPITQVPVPVTVVDLTAAPAAGPATPAPTATPWPTPTLPPTPEPTPTPVPQELVVCMPHEPDTLYDYGGGSRDDILARAAVLAALRDGPIDHRSFSYQPVILQKLPSLSEGDAVLNAVSVREGQPIVDSAGNLTALAAGVRYFDAGGVEQVYQGGGRPAQAMQMTVTFKLLPGLKWEDGRPLTADDVLFAWELAKSPDNPAANHFLPNRTAEAVVVDPQTIRWTYLPGFKDTLYQARFPVPYPRHLYGSLSPPQLAADERVNRRPLSFGPFRLERWIAGDRIVLTKNPNYFRAAEGLPHLDKLTYRFVPNANQMLAELLSGGCSLGIGTRPGSSDSVFEGHVDQLLRAQSQGALMVQFAPGTTIEHLDFNISPAAGYGGLAGDRLFQDVRVRQAFAYCTNRKALVDSLMYGRAEAAAPSVYVPANHPLYDAGSITTYAFSPDRGRALLREAGWEDRNGDGLLDRSGRPLSLSYYYGPTGNKLRQAVAAALQAQLRDSCGIHLELTELGRSDLFGGFPDGALFGRRFDLGQFAWVVDGEPPCTLYTSREWTGLGDGQPDPYGVSSGYVQGGNNVGYLNPAFEAACLGAVEALEPAAKKALHQEAMKIFSQEVPSIMLFVKLRIAVARPNVVGFALDSTQDSEMWNVEQLRVGP